MAKLWTCFSLLLVFSLDQGWNFSSRMVKASEADPTLLKPDNHEAIIDEKEDSNPTKKSETVVKNNDISYNYFNYRIANRTDNANGVFDSAKVLPQVANSNADALKTTANSKNGASGEVVQATSGNTVVNNVPQKYVSHNTQIGAGLQKNANNTSVEKALAFYESILANAKKNEKESRRIKSESSMDEEKNYADGIEDSSLQVCHSDECKKVAEYIKGSMNESTNPCDDFYTFSCGGWKKRNDIPESENEITAFTKLTKKIESATHTLLTQPPQSGESVALVKARKFFYSCMNADKIEKEGAKPALEFIKAIDGWSMCDRNDWKEKSWDVYKVLKDVQSKYYPAPPFFTVEVTNDHLNSTRHLIKVRMFLYFCAFTRVMVQGYDALAITYSIFAGNGLNYT